VSGKPYEPLDLAGRAQLVSAGTCTSQVSLFSQERPDGPERHQRTIALTANRELQPLDDLIVTPAPLLTDKLIPFVGRDLALRLPLQTGDNQPAAPPPGLGGQRLCRRSPRPRPLQILWVPNREPGQLRGRDHRISRGCSRVLRYWDDVAAVDWPGSAAVGQMGY
jgi:hypothetical protein